MTTPTTRICIRPYIMGLLLIAAITATVAVAIAYIVAPTFPPRAFWGLGGAFLLIVIAGHQGHIHAKTCPRNNHAYDPRPTTAATNDLIAVLIDNAAKAALEESGEIREIISGDDHSFAALYGGLRYLVPASLAAGITLEQLHTYLEVNS